MRSQFRYPHLLLMLLGSNVFAAETEVKPKQPIAAAAESKQNSAGPAVANSHVNSSASSATTPRGNDQLVLDSTLVTGNRELPKVMYIVPWKKAELSDLPGQPFNTLIDETLAPVDREVFRREVDYYLVIADKDRVAPDADRQATSAADKK